MTNNLVDQSDADFRRAFLLHLPLRPAQPCVFGRKQSANYSACFRRGKIRNRARCLMHRPISAALDVKKRWHCDLAIAGKIEPAPVMIFANLSHARGYIRSRKNPSAE